MVEPELFLCALETLLDGPAQAGRTGQLGKIGARRLRRISSQRSKPSSTVQGKAMRAHS